MADKPHEPRDDNKPAPQGAKPGAPTPGNQGTGPRGIHDADTQRLDSLIAKEAASKTESASPHAAAAQSAGHETVHLDQLGIRGVLPGSEEPDPEPNQRELAVLMLALGELDDDERDKLLADAEKDPVLAAEIRAMTQHLEAHQKMPRVTPRGGSFMRLSGRMKDDGYLRNVFPGRHALWRRAMFAAAAALVIIIGALVFFAPHEESEPRPERVRVSASTMTLLANDVAPASNPEPIQFGKTTAVGGQPALLLLATSQRGITTRVRLAPHSRFELRARDELHLIEGEALSVEVDPNALYIDDFKLITPEAVIQTGGATFTARTSADRTFACIIVGVVEASPRDTGGREDMSRIITRGMCTAIALGAPAADPFDMVDLRVEKFPGDRQVKITVSNRTNMRVEILKAGGSQPYEITLLQDSRADIPEPAEIIARAPPLVGALPSKAGTDYERHRGVAVLEPEGMMGSRYQYVCDLRALMLGVEQVDYSVSVRYLGKLKTDLFGELNVPIISPYMRLDLKPTGVKTVEEGK